MTLNGSKPSIAWRLLTLVTLGLLILGGACSRGDPSVELSSFGTAPTWELDSQLGNKVASKDLLGKAYVANFMWTHCRDTCPTMSLQMAMLQERIRADRLLGEDAVLVSFSIDPERDTPERLRKYADLFKADPGGWLFLTGDPVSIIEVVTNGFGVSFRSVTPGTDQLRVDDQVSQGRRRRGRAAAEGRGGDRRPRRAFGYRSLRAVPAPGRVRSRRWRGSHS